MVPGLSMKKPAPASPQPSRDCPVCPRLAAFRESIRAREPDWHNAPVPSFGGPDARLLVVGLAPGLRGANRTGRPFTGDWAGDLLFATLLKFGFAKGDYQERPDDGLALQDCMITNAVRCVPPENKPTPAEIRDCRIFLEPTIETNRKLIALVALGRIAHDSVVRALGQKLSSVPFGHGAQHTIMQANGKAIRLFDSYHCSRYNTNTGVLTTQMFEDVFRSVRTFVDESA